MSDKPNDERVLVLGATGMLGHQLVSVLGGSGHEIIGGVRDTDRARALGIEVPLVRFDAMAGEPAIDAALEETRPTAVINAVGVVKQLDSAKQPLPAITLNSLLPHQIAAAAARQGARVIHVSTDCVFSGELPAPAAYTEADHPDPRDLYGRSKLLGELLESEGLTLRTSIIGRELDRSSGLVEWFATQHGQAPRGFTQAIFSGLTTASLARVIDQVLRSHRDLSGLYHVASEPIDKFDLLSRLKEVMGIDCEIEPVDEPRVNRALDGSAFTARTAIDVPSWDEQLEDLRA